MHLPHETSLQDRREKARVDDGLPAFRVSFGLMLKSQLNVGDFFKCSGHPNRRNSAGLFLLPFESGSIEVSHLIGLFGILYTSQ